MIAPLPCAWSGRGARRRAGASTRRHPSPPSTPPASRRSGLALLASHPAALTAAQLEAAEPASRGLPYLRACVLESVRLWPTTPVVLRESTTATTWAGGVMPRRTGVV